jgi:predicted DNA-binding transcriptional regulator YafY
MPKTHPLILRLLRIHRLVQARRYPNIPDLARLLGVSRSTIQRDVDILRDQMGAPLAFNPIEQGYEYTEEGFTFPDVQMSEGEILALMVADRALTDYRGSEYEPLLRRLLAKAAVSLTDQRTVSPQKLAEAQSFLQGPPAERIDPKVFAVMEKALRARETLEISYGAKGSTSKRRVDPYHLANVDGDWYLLGYCHKRQQVGIFKPSKIRRAKSTGDRFLPRRFDPEEFLRTRIEAMAGEKIFEAVLRFDASLAEPILDIEWGEGYRVQILTSGGVELSFRSENADAVIRWCLGWGPGAEIVSPPWVRRRARQILRQLGKRYEKRAQQSKAASSRLGRRSG